MNVNKLGKNGSDKNDREISNTIQKLINLDVSSNESEVKWFIQNKRLHEFLQGFQEFSKKLKQYQKSIKSDVANKVLWLIKASGAYEETVNKIRSLKSKYSDSETIIKLEKEAGEIKDQLIVEINKRKEFAKTLEPYNLSIMF